jgi:hypothetical protein
MVTSYNRTSQAVRSLTALGDIRHTPITSPKPTYRYRSLLAEWLGDFSRKLPVLPKALFWWTFVASLSVVPVIELTLPSRDRSERF